MKKQVKKLNQEQIEEKDLNVKYFHCCGDEDLYPFKCSNCGRIMIFCYECDTLYRDLKNLEDNGRDINHFDPSKPAFSCPQCNYNFEYSFMRNSLYHVTYNEWIKAGFENLLEDYMPSLNVIGSETRYASAYCRKNKILVHSDSLTKDGFTIASKPYFILPIKTSDEELGKAIIEALLNSKYNVPTPDSSDFNKIRQDRLKAIGVKTEKELMEEAKYLAISSIKDKINILPTQNSGKDGFVHLNDLIININVDSDYETIGEKIIEGWEICK